MNVYEGLLVLISIVAIIIAILKIIAKTSEWDTLSTSFSPLHTSSGVLKEYRNVSGFVGNMELDANLTVRVREEGMELHLMNPFMPDLFILWERFSKVEKDTEYRKNFLNFVVSYPANLNFRLPEEVTGYMEGKVRAERFTEGMKVNSVGDVLQEVLKKKNG